MSDTDTDKSNKTFIGPFIDGLISASIDEFKKQNTKDKIIQNIIDPILSDITIRYSPYYNYTMMILIIIIILLLALLIINVMVLKALSNKLN